MKISQRNWNSLSVISLQGSSNGSGENHSIDKSNSSVENKSGGDAADKNNLSGSASIASIASATMGVNKSTVMYPYSDKW